MSVAGNTEKLDLASANNVSGDISILLGRGDGTFLPANNIWTGSPADASPSNSIDLGWSFLRREINRASRNGARRLIR